MSFVSSSMCSGGCGLVFFLSTSEFSEVLLKDCKFEALKHKKEKEINELHEVSLSNRVIYQSSKVKS